MGVSTTFQYKRSGGLERTYQVALTLRHGTVSSSATAVISCDGELKTEAPMYIGNIVGAADFVKASELVKRNIEALVGMVE